ncbi:MAG TPA: GNAT family protein [Solirubrobacteraceae bacterium]|nr:GNAT family protein [Solirubrobacteraceae bacterium]
MDRPLGPDLPGFASAARPSREPLRGAYVELRPVDPSADAEPLFEASRDTGIWTYLFDGPYSSIDEFRVMLEQAALLEDPFRYTIVREGDPEGMCSYLRITPEHGVIEIGNIWFGTPMQRTTAATEAIYLLALNAFDTLGYRRLEWKCNALNGPSRRAAERFGFRFEGVFEQHMVVKGRNRDTAWYAIVDHEWPAIRAGFEAWLQASNFDAGGRQLRTLEQCRA